MLPCSRKPTIVCSGKFIQYLYFFLNHSSTLVPIGQCPDIMLTRQQYNDAYYRGKNIRRFAVRLAEKIFGLDVLAQSTVSGQQTGLEKLDVDKLSAIRGNFNSNTLLQSVVCTLFASI